MTVHEIAVWTPKKPRQNAVFANSVALKRERSAGFTVCLAFDFSPKRAAKDGHFGLFALRDER